MENLKDTMVKTHRLLYIKEVFLTRRAVGIAHIPKQGGIVMKLAKIFTVILLTVAVGLFSCSKEKGTEAPQQEQVIKNLVPPKVESKGESLTVELSELQVFMTVNPVSKEMTETPKLGARYKITNTSKNILNIQGVTLEYLDEGEKPITFASGEKIATASLYLNALKPGETGEGSLDVTIPRAAIKELAKINVNVVYIPSPLKRETLTLPGKVE